MTISREISYGLYLDMFKFILRVVLSFARKITSSRISVTTNVAIPNQLMSLSQTFLKHSVGMGIG